VITVVSLHVYPLKSGAAIPLAAAPAGPRGFPHDRCWMLVDAEGCCLTQREHPALALVRFVPQEGAVRAEAPGMEPLHVPWPPAQGEHVTVRIWSDTVTAAAGSRDADAWFSRYLGAACRLAGAGAGTRRLLPAKQVPEGGEAAFQDSMPYHLVSLSSLAELNRRSSSPVTVERFRPNIVVKGSEPFAEDSWRRIAVGGVPFRVVKPVGRCAVTTVDQSTGARGREPLAVLATFRRRENTVLFGQYLIAEAKGPVHVGDTVDVTAASTPSSPISAP